ncbi:chromosome condensation protein-like protein [Thalassiosira pseudonana CCMP1335]|uniref:Structural maintenance of chromosomes protein n=1 Tax=Thalassiosira pseudonana TaxID=35128 RepID=B8CCA2_THAPS|nr:chromosome condensation protein-like protein [Thalassiosira pseudonana CCMP1335]EED88922.1 chromosome condensation protein-like protein [Thalassiosira pseudonana CCMP1335]
MITKMELENFKSYAGLKQIGPFHKCFSSVVGPNGSGKSNVIDAMLFVFGKRAKKLRLNKVSELIHSSDAYTGDKELQYARVNVYFHEIVDTGEGDEEYEIVPGSELVVSRVARRDNSSQYQMDGKNATFKKVAEYLGSKGIDLDNNRFLILQGEVEMISMMPPKGKNENDEGLLEYLEDIIGSNKYVEQANAAAEKVEQLTEVRQEKLNRVKAAEKEKDGLAGAKAEAQALVGKDREIRRKKNILHQIHGMFARKEGEAAREQRVELVEQLEGERLKLSEADERVREIESGMTEQQSDYDRVFDELTTTKGEYTAWERQDIQMKENIKFEKSNIKKLEGKVVSEKKKMDDATEALEEAMKSIPTLEERIEECTENKSEEDAKLEVIFEETKGITEQLRHELEEKTQELAPLLQERTIFQNSLDTAQMEVNLLEDTVQRSTEQLVSAENELASLDSKQDGKKEELARCEVELREGKERVAVAEEELKGLEGRESGLVKKSNELLTQVEIAKASMQSSSGRSRVATAILKASKKGGELEKCGVMGRLGDLATIDGQYDVAISTACGMLDHIVVQTTAGTQKCLEFLRKHNLGRASFVPLDKMKKGAHDRTVETPEGAPRLFDLITPANFHITPALFLAVGNTLVAPDLETATRWAYEFGKRWRVVSMDGKLIETSGTMSGGGQSVQRGKMKLSTSPEDCKKLEDEAAKAQEEVKKCRVQRRELTDEIRSLNKKIKTLSVKLPQLQMEIAGFDTTREELTNRLPSLREQSTLSDADQQKKDELLKKVDKCKSEMASCVAATSKLEAEVSKLQKSIINAGGSKLKNQQKACDQAKKDLNDANKDLNSAKSTITNSKKTIQKAEKVMGTAQTELESSKEALEQMQEEHKTRTSEAKDLLEAYEGVKKVEAEKRKELEAVAKECEKLKQAQTKLKCAEVELSAKIENLDKQIKDSERKVAHYKKEIDILCRVERQEENDYDFSDDEEEEDDDDKMDQEPDAKEEDDEEEDVDIEEVTSEKNLDAEAKSIKNDISVLEKERDTLAKNANMGAIAEYRKKEADYLSRVSDLDQITNERNEARKAHDDLRRLRLEKFMDGFSRITLKLKEMYQMITLGGDAELELVDSLDPFSEGIVFSVRPPKKSWKNIANLSGGEKTLSSLALVFALHHYKPTPLYVMDEIDAALDFKNVSIVAHYIKERTKNAQFIIISLRNNMFELADRLVGIYKTNDCTKSITINPRLYSKEGKVSLPAEAAPQTPLLDRTNANVSTCPTPA